MGLADVLRSLCCCRHGVRDGGGERIKEETQAVLSNGGAGEEGELQRPWGGPKATSHIVESDSDVELHTFITLRSQADKDTEEWEKLNFDIHTLRFTRRKVSSRWKKILQQMGYQKEVDSLLTVNRQSILTDSEDPSRAGELLCELWRESSLFPKGYNTPDKYLLIMDRLLSLDSAEEFVELAKKKYPKN